MRLRSALEETAAVGHSLVRGALAPARTEELLDELAPCGFAPLEPVIGTVRQRGEGLTLDLDDDACPLTAELVSELTGEVRTSGIPGTADYAPDEITCQRYLDERSGIGPHMDQRRYRLLVAAFTLVGEAPFTVFEDRSATAVVRAWTTGRGDLCLLRAPGLAGQPDGRPTHSVGGPARGARVSLTVRASRSALDPARQR
ncbi:MAG: hypothetical protein E6G01_07745 [Actinobacteria bacterium]|nr:MAG: hypothetical protein E6G01_07745 [Actinomycetota bacterium]